jgi:hypothetical protein
MTVLPAIVPRLVDFIPSSKHLSTTADLMSFSDRGPEHDVSKRSTNLWKPLTSAQRIYDGSDEKYSRFGRIFTTLLSDLQHVASEHIKYNGEINPKLSFIGLRTNLFSKSKDLMYPQSSSRDIFFISSILV